MSLDLRLWSWNVILWKTNPEDGCGGNRGSWTVVESSRVYLSRPRVVRLAADDGGEVPKYGAAFKIVTLFS